MPNWIISPDKYLTDDEVKQLRKTLLDTSTLAKARGSQIAVRDQLIIELASGRFPVVVTSASTKWSCWTFTT